MASELNELIRLIYQSPSGSAKTVMIEKAIRLAESQKAFEEEIELRYQLIKENTFHGDCFKAVLAFPRYVSLIEKHQDEVEYYEIYKHLWAFKYIIENGINFHQISRDKLEHILEQFKQKCLDYGYSLRAYYAKKIFYAMYDHNKEEAKKYYQQFKLCKRDSLSDCLACERDFEAEYQLFIDDFNRAEQIAKPLFTGEMSCAEVPHITYSKFIHYYLLNNQVEQVSEIQKKAYRLISRNKSFLKDVAAHMLYFAMTAPKDGIKLFTKHLEWATTSRNEQNNFHFYTASWLLWEQVALNTNRKAYTLRLPKTIPFYNEDNKYEFTDLIQFCKEQAFDLANKLDKRDQSSNHIDEINQLKELVEQYDPKMASQLIV